MSPQEIFTLFGRTVVLLRVNGKAPVDPAWDDMTVGHMTEAYLAGLNGNIGILHGAASGNLNGIEFDSVEAAKSWFRANRHWAENCLWSKGKRGPCFWVFIRGDYPKNHNLYDEAGNQVGEWRADGRQTVFSGTHPDGMVYTHKGTPVRITYNQIVWPGDVRVAKPAPPAPDLDAILQARHGPPYWVDQWGNVTKINQVYLANRFCAENLVLFEQDEGASFRYREENGAWNKVIQDAVKKMVQDEWTRLVALFAVASLHKKAANSTFNAITELVRSISGRTRVFSPLTRVVHCANGMLHLLEDGECELRPFSPEYYARNPTPINWNPEAICPKFQSILDTMEADDADLLLRYAANVLLGGNPAQQILILTGEGGTSKSTVCEIIELVVGRRNVAELRTEHLDNRFEIGRYIGKTLLSGKDVKGDFLESEGAARIKALTGHDMLTGEVKMEMGTPEIYGNFAVIITCNERLTVKLEGDIDMSAWARRLMMIEFTQKSKHKEVIPNYSQKLFAEEGEGILVLVVKAAFRHLKELKTIGTFAQTKAQKDRIEGLLAESRSVELFVKECVFRQKGSDISSDELLTAYNNYCETKGWDPVVAGKFQKYVVNHMVRFHQSNVGSNILREDNGGKERRVRGYPNVVLVEGDPAYDNDFDFNESET